jgi:hypothetical protein
MEQLAVITIFAVCAAVCVKILAGSFLMANDTRDRNHALAAAKNCAEYFKACGEPGKTAAALSGRGYADCAAATVYYDGGWRVCDETEAAYALRLKSDIAGAVDKNASPLLCELSVERITGEELVRFTVSVNRARAGRQSDE